MHGFGNSIVKLGALALAGALAGGCLKPVGEADAFPVPERHRPKVIMGRDYWTLLMSFWYTDPTFTKCGMKMPPWMDNPELRAKPVFRDCAIIHAGGRKEPDPDTGKATHRTLAEYFAPEQYANMEKCPKPDNPMFLLASGMRGHWKSVYTGAIDLDLNDYAAWKARHPNCQGFVTCSEWDSDPWTAWWNCTIYRKRWPYSDASCEALKAFLSPWPTNRCEHVALMRKTLERMYAIHFGEREKSVALRCSMAVDHLAAAWGIRYLMVETTGTSRPPQEYRWTIQPMFTRGAARQFDIPWGWYVAQFVNGYRKDGTWQNDSAAWTCLEDKLTPREGISPSLNRRVFYFAYLSGANTVQMEGWHAAFLRRDETTKMARFTERGQAFSDYHDFTAAHPDRGTPYTPVAVLVPFDRGYPACGGRAWGVYPYTSGDQATDAVFFTINPGYDRDAFIRKGGEANLHNSKYALMYDVICPDAPQKPEDLLAALSCYRAVVQTGDYRDRTFEKTLAQYEKAGGRVIRIDPKALPAIGSDGKKAVNEVLTGKRSFPTVAKILDGLQEDYFPFQVAGDVMYGANRVDGGARGARALPTGGEFGTPGGRPLPAGAKSNNQTIAKSNNSPRWWLWCFNNKGVTKFTDEYEQIDPTAVAPVKIGNSATSHFSVLTSRSRVTELLSGKSIPVSDGTFSYTIAPGDLAIFEIAIFNPK